MVPPLPSTVPVKLPNSHLMLWHVVFGDGVSGRAGDAQSGSLVVQHVGCGRWGGVRRIGQLRFCNLTASFAADLLQVQRFGGICAV